MPSLSFISTIVMAVLAVTPTLAQTPPRGRPNHADLYGYPHNRGPPPAGPRKPMRPGQYMDPRPANPGAQCQYNNQCSTAVKNAIASCGTDGVCTFKCLGATTFDGTTCAGDIVNPNPRCSFDRQCSTTVSDATGRCVAGRCTFACNRGFYAPNPNATACSPASLECGGQTCPEIPGGYSLCRDGQCLARCEGQLGFKQFCNADNSVCECINVANDTNNCGAPGNVCPPSYNGKGRAFCAAGQCGLSCYRLTKVQPRDAPAYCT